MNSIQPLLRGDRGDSLVEFALASVVFFMTIFGVIVFGLAIWQYNMVANLAQEGARWASVRGKSSSTPASSNAVQDYVISRAVGINLLTVTTTPDPSTLDAGATVTVLVSKPFTPATTLIPNSTLTLQSTAKMIMAR